MAMIKCKMCGGDLNLVEGQSVCECEYCGSRQTVPNQDNEKKLQQFERADWLRRNCEFDRAAAVYESIVAEFREESEAYWGLVLCKYGIEYVDDPGTGKKIPTCHRSSFDSVMEDPSLELAMDYADTVARRVYREEAKQIEEIRKGIIAVSANEQPYDIFICYKETDEKGDRTLDSVLAQDIYDALNEKGYRVFFARISLEDKLGVEYEPYIFAALNSAKIMLAVGTDYEYYNAVWVKNEWGRFLKLMAQDKTRHLIPCYKNIDAYDMPKEFAKLQAQDLGKVGAMQDLLRGIEKILPRQKNTTVIQERALVGSTAPGSKNESLLDRGYMALEDKAWAEADKFFEEVLNNDSKNAKAYLGKLLAAEKHSTLMAFAVDQEIRYAQAERETLKLETDQAHIDKAANEWSIPGYLSEETLRKLYPFDLSYHSWVSEKKSQCVKAEAFWKNNRWLSRAVQFAEGDLAQKLEAARKEILDTLNRNVKQAEQEDAAAIAELKARYAAHLAKADAEAERLHREAESRREKDYEENLQTSKNTEDPAVLDKCAGKFEALGEFRDSKALAAHCRKRAEEIREEIRQKEIAEKARLAEEAERRLIAQRKAEREAAAKKKKITMILAGVAAAVLAVIILVVTVVMPAVNYNKAGKLDAEEKYIDAAKIFLELGNYKDSPERYRESIYAWAEKLLAEGNYEEAGEAFASLGDYEDIRAKQQEAKQAEAYAKAEALVAEGKYLDAAKKFQELKDYSDAAKRWEECMDICYHSAEALAAEGKYQEAAIAFYKIKEYQDAFEKSFELWGEITQRDTISAGRVHTVGLKTDGTVVAVGYNKYGQCDVTEWTDIVAISAGEYHTVGLKADGTVVAVGWNDDGQCKVSSWTDIVAISAGYYHTVGLKADGTVVAVGFSDDGRCDVSGWRDIVAVFAGGYHTVGLKADGTVVAVGWSDDGQCDVTEWTDIVTISAGGWHTVGLKADGMVVAVGYNDDGQSRSDVSGWRDITAISAGRYNTLGMKADGTVVAVGYNEYGQCDVTEWTDIVAISAGGWHTVGLKADGTVVTVGANTEGQCDASGWKGIKIPD